jgi:hypothetical protein
MVRPQLRIVMMRLLFVVILWALVALIFFSPASMSLGSLEDLLINERWQEPKTEWRPSESRHSSHPGRSVMWKTNVTFLGVGRNLGSRLPIVLQQIEMLGNEFAYSRAIFVEGGSSDNTSAILRDWAKSSSSSNRTVITMPGNDSFEKLGHFAGLKLPREGRLSNARNVGLSELYRLAETGLITEYVIVVDLDVLGWDPYGVSDSFVKSSSWDVICANGVLLHGVYRDTYAFRTPKLNTNHHWAGNDELLYNITSEEKKKHRQNLKVFIGHGISSSTIVLFDFVKLLQFTLLQTLMCICC